MRLLLVPGLAACLWAGIILAQSARAGLGVSDAASAAIGAMWPGSGDLSATPPARPRKPG